MIPSVRALLLAHQFGCRRFGWKRPPLDDLIAGLTDAHLEALRLADGSGDEAASLFYACGRYAAELGEDVVHSVAIVTVNQATALGRQVSGDPVPELREKARQIAVGAVSFEEFRAWLAERLPHER